MKAFDEIVSKMRKEYELLMAQDHTGKVIFNAEFNFNQGGVTRKQVEVIKKL